MYTVAKVWSWNCIRYGLQNGTLVNLQAGAAADSQQLLEFFDCMLHCYFVESREKVYYIYLFKGCLCVSTRRNTLYFPLASLRSQSESSCHTRHPLLIIDGMIGSFPDSSLSSCWSSVYCSIISLCVVHTCLVLW